MAGELIVYNGTGSVGQLKDGDALTTYSQKDWQGKIATLRAMGKEDFQLSDLDGQEIAVEHIVAHWADMAPDDSGEIKRSVRYVLISKDGVRVSTRSNPAVACIKRAADYLGLTLPFDPPLRFRVGKVKSEETKRLYLQLELLGPANGEVE